MKIIGRVEWCTNCGALKIADNDWQLPDEYQARNRLKECEHGLSTSKTNPLAERVNTKKSDMSSSSGSIE